jgi:hypothetical protein
LINRTGGLSVVLLLGIGLLVCLLQASAALADDQPAAPEAPGSISGTVRDEAGAALAGIVVNAWRLNDGNPSGWVARTDANGAYRIGLLPAGRYLLRFRDEAEEFATLFYGGVGLSDKATDIPVAGNAVTGSDQRLPRGGTISGTVSFLPAAAGGGTGNADEFTLRLYQRNDDATWYQVQLATTTRAYRLKGLLAGVYRVCVEYGYLENGLKKHECYDNVYTIADATDLILAPGGVVTDVNFILDDGADLARFSGIVTSAQDGSALAGIKVNVLWRGPETENSFWHTLFVTRTDTNGLYRFNNLPPAVYTLQFIDEQKHYVDEVYNDRWSLMDATPLTLTRNMSRGDLNVSLTVASRIQGVVTVESEGPPRYALVSAEQTSAPSVGYWSVNIDPFTGHYRLNGLPPGVYTLKANVELDGGYRLLGYYGGASLAEATPLTLTLGMTQSGADIILRPYNAPSLYSGAVSGRVTAAGAPVAGIQVALHPEDIGRPSLVYTFTNADGRYTLGGLLDELYHLRFIDPTHRYATSYYPQGKTPRSALAVVIEGGKTITNADAQLVLGGGIRGHVRLGDGTPLPDIQVRLFGYLDPEGEANPIWQFMENAEVTDASGAYALYGLHPAIYRICFSDPRNVYPYRCYGAGIDPDATYAQDLHVEAGQTLTDIDQRLGPDVLVYFPFVIR